MLHWIRNDCSEHRWENRLRRISVKMIESLRKRSAGAARHSLIAVRNALKWIQIDNDNCVQSMSNEYYLVHSTQSEMKTFESD